MSEKDKKLHWYLGYIKYRFEDEKGSVQGNIWQYFSSETQNINRSKLDEIKEVHKNNLLKLNGEDIEVIEIGIFSLSYLGYMTEEEFNK